MSRGAASKPAVDLTAGIRLDIWLWAARMYRSRSLAKQAVDGGKVECNGHACKPSRLIQPGDRLRLTRDQDRLELEVLQLGHLRGPASIAQTLYRETDASIDARTLRKEQAQWLGPGLQISHRPDKRSRRLIKQFKAQAQD